MDFWKLIRKLTFLTLFLTFSLPSSPLAATATPSALKVAAGHGFTLALMNDGTIWGWGSNSSGQLGPDAALLQLTPIQIGEDNQWVSLYAGKDSAFAIMSDGTLWAWGENSSGTLGTGDTADRNRPTRIGTDTDWKEVGAGWTHTMALKTNGTMWSWGSNSKGQRISYSGYDLTVPSQVGTDTDWKTVSAGWEFTMAIKTDGTLWTAGDGGSYRTGVGIYTSHSLRQVGTDNDWASVVAGFTSGGAIKTNGTLWGWGSNIHGQVGNGSPLWSSVKTPVQAGTDTNWVALSRHDAFTLALKSDGTLWSWGQGNLGQLGNGKAEDKRAPTQVGIGSNWISVASGRKHSAAVDSAGNLYTWGQRPALGDGVSSEQLVPGQVGLDTDYSFIQAEYIYSFAIKGGAIVSWGNGEWGYLGNGAEESFDSPTAINGDTDWAFVDNHEYFSLAVKTDGTLWGWGDTGYGQLGDINLPMTVFAPVQVGTDNTWSKVTTGGEHAIGLKSDGTLWGWGENLSWQAGFPDKYGEYYSPLQIGTDTDWIGSSATWYQTLAVKSDGTLWGWGFNSSGQLGDGTKTDRMVPTRIGTDTDWVKVETEYFYTLGLKSDGTLWEWGSTPFGDDGYIDILTPTQLGTDSNWQSVSTSEYFVLGVKTDGTLWAWGRNNYGQLGDGTKTTRANPIQIGTDTDWSMVAAGNDYSLALKQDNSLWSWGNGGEGNLGHGIGWQETPLVINTITPAIVVDTISGDTTEGLATASFGVHLATAPTDDVTLTLSSSDTGEGILSHSTLTFTPINWKDKQTITVTGIDDALLDGDQNYSVDFGASSSNDSDYSGLNLASLNLKNIDNDSPGITVSAISGDTTESGGTATFTIKLTSQPSFSVTLPLSSSNTAEGTLAQSSLTIDPADWNIPQVVTITGVDDITVDGSQSYTITIGSSTSSDSNYQGIDPGDLTVNNTDDDLPGFVLSSVLNNISEDGTTGSFDIALKAKPLADVTVGVSSNWPAEGTSSPPSLTFTPTDWNVPQTVTVTPKDDFIDDGNKVIAIIVSDSQSTNPLYNGIAAPHVGFINADNDTAGFIITPAGGTPTEDGGFALFNIKLSSEPEADVLLPLALSDTTEGSLSPSSLTFTSSNWNAEKTVTVTGVDDAQTDGDQLFTLLLQSVTSNDPNYHTMDPADQSLTNIDNDSAGFFLVDKTGNPNESGAGGLVSLRLTSQPLADVTVNLSSSAPLEAVPVPTSLTFTPTDWNSVHLVTFKGVDDLIADGDQPVTLVVEAASSTDNNYNGMDPTDHNFTNIDDDSPGFTVTALTGNTTEDGTKAFFTVKLNSQPLADVTVPVLSDSYDEGQTDSTSLTFTPSNWNWPQTVTVTGMDDLQADGNQPYSIDLGPAQSTDLGYQDATLPSLPALNIDNDSPGIVVGPLTGSTTELGGIATFTVVLTSQPTADVSVDLSSSNIGEVTLIPATLTFTSTDWNQPQTATATGVADGTQDGNQEVILTLAPALSPDTTYNGIDPIDRIVVNIDKDSAASTTDSDGDGVMDNVDQSPADATIATPQTATDTGQIAIDASSIIGAQLASVQTFLSDDPGVNQTGRPAGYQFQDGMVKFKINNVTVGQTVQITLTFPNIPEGSKCYKSGPSGFFEVPCQIHGNTMTLSITDGGIGDQDGIANGVIDDPIGIAVPQVTEQVDDNLIDNSENTITPPVTEEKEGSQGAGGGSGGGGCFVNTLDSSESPLEKIQKRLWGWRDRLFR